MNKDLIKTGEDNTNEYFTAYYQGQPITFSKNKLTDEVHINADQAIQALGFDGSFRDYLGTDEGLDLISDWKKDHPDIPFFGNTLKTSKQSN
ncbi:hypothetical protein LDB17_01505 [Dysgonomonas sp. Shenzhen-Wh21]|uniref:hypothetical protein n=1 Tax=Dysgonomonas TaxID=156973 RepID=UPI00208F562F|nr:hypothetical protein [Dysgonomonas mossii]